MLGFIVAAVAGFIAPQLEAPVARPLARMLEKHITLEAAETRLLAFIVALLGAGIVGSLLDSGSTFWMVLGAALGYFGTRLVAAARAFMDARKEQADDE
ncbi:MAG: hypothetical protein ABF248_08375 [Yoonia sp.]